jgi:nucleolar protein 56
MTLHISECVLGVFAFDDAGEMVAYERFPDDPAEIAGRLASVQMGTPTPEHRSLIGKLIERGETSFTLEQPKLAENMAKEFRKVRFEVQAPNRAGLMLRGKLHDIAEEVGYRNVDRLIREVNFVLTKLKLKKEISQRDKLIIRVVEILDELDKFINILTVRVREWYSMHFPELDRLIPDHQNYLRLVLELGSRENFKAASIKSLTKFSDELAAKIEEAARSSVGASFDEVDIQTIQDEVRLIVEMQKVRERTAEYIDGLMEQVAPNLKTLVGGTIGARLIALAGGLEDLARMPASTIQVLGAEKALFRALKTKAKPPKHGVIYQHPSIRSSPRKLRGKIARALAGKIAIAARLDAMAGEFMGDRLLEDFRARVSKIHKEMG